MSVKLFLAVAIVAIFVTVNSAQSSPQQSSTHNVKESNGNTRKMRLLTMNPGVVRFYRMMGGSGGPRQQEDEAVPDDDSYFQKRQQYDDYGHMRFGKRNPDFDDYGHMRFGK